MRSSSSMTATPCGQTDAPTSLTNLLRARRGTNYATSGHKARPSASSCSNRTARSSASGTAASEWDKTHSFKPVPTGTYAEDATGHLGRHAAERPQALHPRVRHRRRRCAPTSRSPSSAAAASATSWRTEAPNVPYKEGQGALAHFVYKVWGNKLLTDTPWSDWDRDRLSTAPWRSTRESRLVDPLTFAFAHAGLTSFVIGTLRGWLRGWLPEIRPVRTRPRNFRLGHDRALLA
jgi:hypothetical protein